jgi:hypothetical protein
MAITDPSKSVGRTHASTVIPEAVAAMIVVAAVMLGEHIEPCAHSMETPPPNLPRTKSAGAARVRSIALGESSAARALEQYTGESGAQEGVTGAESQPLIPHESLGAQQPSGQTVGASDPQLTGSILATGTSRWLGGAACEPHPATATSMTTIPRIPSG